jgi:hypothetical protein
MPSVVPAQVLDLNIDAGATFSETFQLVDVNSNPVAGLTGYIATFQVRKTMRDGYLFLNKTPSFDATTATITLTLTAADTSSLVQGKFVYGIELAAASGEPVIRIVQGAIYVDPEVVR